MMVPAVEIGVVEELFFYGVLCPALMKCSMEHVAAAMGVKLQCNGMGAELETQTETL